MADGAAHVHVTHVTRSGTLAFGGSAEFVDASMIRVLQTREYLDERSEVPGFYFSILLMSSPVQFRRDGPMAVIFSELTRYTTPGRLINALLLTVWPPRQGAAALLKMGAETCCSHINVGLVLNSCIFSPVFRLLFCYYLIIVMLVVCV